MSHYMLRVLKRLDVKLQTPCKVGLFVQCLSLITSSWQIILNGRTHSFYAMNADIVPNPDDMVDCNPDYDMDSNPDDLPDYVDCKGTMRGRRGIRQPLLYQRWAGQKIN